MKLSTKSRYGTRMIMDLAQRYGQGTVQLGEIASRQKISLKYLEQIIRPLKQAGLIKSFRGAKGGHVLNRPPEEVTVGEVVALLEGGKTLVNCDREPEVCARVDTCVTRHIWQEAAPRLLATPGVLGRCGVFRGVDQRESARACPPVKVAEHYDGNQ